MKKFPSPLFLPVLGSVLLCGRGAFAEPPDQPRAAALGAEAGNVIRKAFGGSRTAGTLIGGSVGAIAGAATGAVRDASDRHDLVSELIAILNETKSVSTFYLTLGVLAEMGPRAEPAIPAIIRNAERLDCGAGSTDILERTIKAVLRKDDLTKTRHRKPSTTSVGGKKQARRTASGEEMALLAGQVRDEFDHPAVNATVLIVAARQGGQPAPEPFRVQADRRGYFFIPGLDRDKQYQLTAQVKEDNRIVAEGGVFAQVPDPCIIIRVSAAPVRCVPTTPPR
jgi:hypothetical protein